MPKKIPIGSSLNFADLNDKIGAIRGIRSETVIAWYKVAKSNLSSADLILKQNGYIPHVIFLIQQCVECLVKGTFLEAGILTKENIHLIKHHPDKAYKTLYTHIGYEYGLYLCDEVSRQLAKATNFTDSMIINASIANQFTRKYWEDFDNAPVDYVHFSYKDPTILGLPSNASQLCCHYQFLASMYAENILFLLSCVFTHEVEQGTRYPKLHSNGIILPDELYDNEKIRDGLPTVVTLLKSICNTIFGASRI